MDKLPLEQLEVLPYLNVVTRGPWLYDAGSRINLSIKVDLLSLDKCLHFSISWTYRLRAETIHGTLIHQSLATRII
jgi:hypothetical protein